MNKYGLIQEHENLAKGSINASGYIKSLEKEISHMPRTT